MLNAGGMLGKPYWDRQFVFALSMLQERAFAQCGSFKLPIVEGYTDIAMQAFIELILLVSVRLERTDLSPFPATPTEIWGAIISRYVASGYLAIRSDSRQVSVCLPKLDSRLVKKLSENCFWIASKRFTNCYKRTHGGRAAPILKSNNATG